MAANTAWLVFKQPTSPGILHHTC